jgi:hypothetical protein
LLFFFPLLLLSQDALRLRILARFELGHSFLIGAAPLQTNPSFVLFPGISKTSASG